MSIDGEVQIRVKRGDKRRSGFIAEQRDDDRFYFIRVPPNCPSANADDQLLEINGVRWTDFQDEDHANELLDNPNVKFIRLSIEPALSEEELSDEFSDSDEGYPASTGDDSESHSIDTHGDEEEDSGNSSDEDEHQVYDRQTRQYVDDEDEEESSERSDDEEDHSPSRASIEASARKEAAARIAHRQQQHEEAEEAHMTAKEEERERARAIKKRREDQRIQEEEEKRRKANLRKQGQASGKKKAAKVRVKVERNIGAYSVGGTKPSSSGGWGQVSPKPKPSPSGWSKVSPHAPKPTGGWSKVTSPRKEK